MPHPVTSLDRGQCCVPGLYWDAVGGKRGWSCLGWIAESSRAPVDLGPCSGCQHLTARASLLPCRECMPPEWGGLTLIHLGPCEQPCSSFRPWEPCSAVPLLRRKDCADSCSVKAVV